MTVLEAELGSSIFRELVASCLSFSTRLILLESDSITQDIVKNLRRGQTVTVQKRDSKGLTGTVQMFVDEQL